MARPHDEQGKPSNYRRSKAADVARYGSSGALLTTPADYAKFLIEVIDPKRSDAFRLNQASLTEMLRSQVKVAETSEYSIWWGPGIACTQDGEVIGHGGENPGFQSIAEASVKRRSGFVIMTNGQNGAKLIEKLGPAVAQKLYSLSN